MQGVVLLVICAATLADFATAAWNAPGMLKFVPEMLSGVVAVLVLLKGLRGGLSLISPGYWVVFGFLAFIIICGILTNDVGSGPTLAGMRYYLRAIPLFFLPAVAGFTEKDMRQQLRLVLGLALLQVPVAAYQRWVIMSQGRFSGDDVRGTVMDSGILSTLLICVALVLLGFFMRKRLSKWPFLIVFFVLLSPTTINETKATVVLLPIGLFMTIMAAAPRGKRIQVFLGGTAMLGAFAAILFPVYAAMNANSPDKERAGLLDFFTNEKQLGEYLADKKDVQVGGAKHLVGRSTAIRVPLEYLSRDPVHLAFGLGLGNVSHSSIGEAFTGSYYDLFKNFAVSSFAVFLLELGILGTGLVLLLYWLVFKDALAVARLDSGITGAIAAGWIGVVAVMGVALFYDVQHGYASLSYLYWYFSGVVATRRVQLMQQQSAEGALRSGAA